MTFPRFGTIIIVMNERTNRAIEFTIHYGEMSSAYNERMMSYDPIEILEEGWKNEYIGLKKEDLGEVLDIFEEDFLVWENVYRYKEVLDIRKWIEEKRA